MAIFYLIAVQPYIQTLLYDVVGVSISLFYELAIAMDVD